MTSHVPTRSNEMIKTYKLGHRPSRCLFPFFFLSFGRPLLSLLLSSSHRARPSCQCLPGLNPRGVETLVNDSSEGGSMVVVYSSARGGREEDERRIET